MAGKIANLQTRLLLADAIQHLLADITLLLGDSHVNPTSTNGRRGKDFVAKLIFGDQFEFSRVRLEYKALASFVDDEDVFANHYG